MVSISINVAGVARMLFDVNVDCLGTSGLDRSTALIFDYEPVASQCAEQFDGLGIEHESS